MKLVKVLSLAAILTVAASSQAAFSFTTGFESGEGYTVGSITGQNGWTTFTNASVPTHALSPAVSNANAAGGSQHLRLTDNTASANGSNNGAFSPVFTPGVNDVYTVSVDTYFNSVQGADYYVTAQDTTAGFVNFRVNFDWQGNIWILDNPGTGLAYQDTGVAWANNAYKNLTIVHDITGNSLKYFYDGAEIYSSASFTAVTQINQVVIYGDNWENAGEYADFDNLSVTGTEAVPEPATMAVLAAAGLAAARRRRK